MMALANEQNSDEVESGCAACGLHAAYANETLVRM
jgi:hypothetical protein